MRNERSINESSVGTLARGLDILALFGRDGPELSQTQMSDALGLPLPTVHRLTAVLAERGFLERDAQSRRYRLGLELARLIPALLSGLRLPDLVRPHLRALAGETGETVNLAALQDGEVVYLLSETGDRLLTSHTPVGLRLPAHCTALGKALLAQLPEAAARDAAGPAPYPRRTAATITTWKGLRLELQRVRAEGVARSWDEYEVGLAAVAVPLAGVAGEGAALNVSLPTSRATTDLLEELGGRLRVIAEQVEGRLATRGG